MHIIEHLFSTLADDIYPLKRKNKEYIAATSEYADALDEYLFRLTAEQRATALDLEARRNNLAYMDEEFAFTHGFRTAAKLFQELLYPPL